MTEKLEYELTVPRNDLDKALDGATKKSFSLEGALTTALGVFAGGVALKGLELLGKGIGETIDFAKDAVKAYGEQEDSLNKLRQSIRATGDESASSFEDLSAFSDVLARTSRNSNEAINQQLAFGKSLGLSNEKTKELVQAAANLSATFGGTLETNVQLLNKALNGNIGKLGQYVTELKGMTAAQLAAGDAAAFINEKFNGNAASEMDTYTGSVIASENAYEDLKKSIGGVIVDVLHLKDINSFLGSIYDALTAKVLEFSDAMNRGDADFKETESSITRLSQKIPELTDEIEIQEERLKAYEEQAKTSFSAAGQVAHAKNNLIELRKEYENITKTVTDFYNAQTTPDVDTGGGGAKDPTREELERRQKANAEILSLKQQLVLEENNIDLANENLKITNDEERNARELERMTNFALTKAELDYQLKEQQLLATQDGVDRDLALKQNGAEKELALLKIKNDAIIKSAGATRDAEKKAAMDRLALQTTTANQISGIIGVSANVASVFAKEGSKEAFFIQKAAALGQASIATWLAIANANAVPPPGNIPAMAAAKAQGAIAISGILASAIKGFAMGGVIGDGSESPSMGPDNQVINARKGEVMLTADDQKELLTAIRGGGMGGDIVIQIDGMTIFRAVRNKIKQGYKLA